MQASTCDTDHAGEHGEREVEGVPLVDFARGPFIRAVSQLERDGEVGRLHARDAEVSDGGEGEAHHAERLDHDSTTENLYASMMWGRGLLAGKHLQHCSREHGCTLVDC